MFRNSHAVFGSCLLAFAVAAVNVAFLLETGTSVSHLTGDVSKLAADISRTSPEIAIEARQVATAAVGFIMGAVFSGFLIHRRDVELSRPYGRSVIGIGLLFLASHWVIRDHTLLAISLAAFACGMQNALATRFQGIILRTTHLTGLLTDLGATIGMRLRGHQVPRHGILIPLFICLSYFAGAFTGSIGMLKFHLPLLPIAGGTYAMGGVTWTILKRTLWKS